MIRYAKPADYPAIRVLLDQAFGQSVEGDIVDELRADGEAMFELVAEIDGQIMGHIMFSRLWADSANLYSALGPMAVHPTLQNTGIGEKLGKTGLANAREFGAHAVIVLGHPGYYPRFGFTPEAAQQVTSPFSGNPAFMALALEEGALSEPLMIAYPAAFKVR